MKLNQQIVKWISELFDDFSIYFWVIMWVGLGWVCILISNESMKYLLFMRMESITSSTHSYWFILNVRILKRHVPYTYVKVVEFLNRKHKRNPWENCSAFFKGWFWSRNTTLTHDFQNPNPTSPYLEHYSAKFRVRIIGPFSCYQLSVLPMRDVLLVKLVYVMGKGLFQNRTPVR